MYVEAIDDDRAYSSIPAVGSRDALGNYRSSDFSPPHAHHIPVLSTLHGAIHQFINDGIANLLALLSRFTSLLLSSLNGPSIVVLTAMGDGATMSSSPLGPQ